MIVIRDPSAMSSIGSPDIRALVTLRITQLCDGSNDPYDADMLAYMVVVETGDTVAQLESECGCPILHNYFEPEIHFGNPGFVPSHEWLEDHGCCKLQAEGSKFALDINASPENKTQVSIVVRGSALPPLPNWVFDDLDAKGELTGDGLVITELDGRIMGGILKGDARIDWSSGWRAQGVLTAKTITMQNMSKALNGDMDGTASFRMQSPSLAKLAETASLEGDFAIRKGIINSIDVVETARMRSTENLPGGRTHFDELSGKLSYANGDYHFRQVKMSTGVLNATATLDIAKQQVSGRVIADLTMRAGMDPIVLQVGGTPDNPSLRAIR